MKAVLLPKVQNIEIPTENEENGILSPTGLRKSIKAFDSVAPSIRGKLEFIFGKTNLKERVH
jgi:hypothetical protein